MRPMVASIEIVVLGALAHAGAGGTLPATAHLGVLTAAVGCACFALHQRLLRLPAAVSVAVAAQLAVHLHAVAPAAHAGHPGAPLAGNDGPMLLSHLVSVAVTAMVLMWQEQALIAVADALVPLRARSAALFRVEPGPVGSEPSARPSVSVLDVAPRRGPPSYPACVTS